MTYIYKIISIDRIAQAFYNDDDASWRDNYKACMALAEYLNEYVEGMGEPLELDIVSVRCDYMLYSDIAELNKEYGTEFKDMGALEDQATVIRVDRESFITDYTGG